MSSSPSTVTSPRPVGDEAAVGNYGRIAAWLSKRVEMALALMDLTLPQYRVMGILAEGSAAASGLADRLAVRPPSITAIIDGLVARGLVDRKQEDSDRRRVAVRLTDEGKRVYEAADRSVNEHMSDIAACLPSKDQVMALRSLELWGEALSNFHHRTDAK